MSNESLIAWTSKDDGDVLAAFVAPNTERQPAMRRCANEDEARAWVKKEADALGLPVEWET